MAVILQDEVVVEVPWGWWSQSRGGNLGVASISCLQISLGLSDGSLVLASFRTKVVAVMTLASCLLIFTFDRCLVCGDHGDLMPIY
jgi:hypothetical protein